jgi:DNA-binding response OmpR family regulator
MPKKVLIIEDSLDIGESLKLLIEYEGYEAVVASGGFEGFAKARDEGSGSDTYGCGPPGRKRHRSYS